MNDDLKEKLKSLFLDYGHDLVVSGGKLDNSADKAMNLFEQYAAKELEGLPTWFWGEIEKQDVKDRIKELNQPKQSKEERSES